MISCFSDTIFLLGRKDEKEGVERERGGDIVV